MTVHNKRIWRAIFGVMFLALFGIAIAFYSVLKPVVTPSTTQGRLIDVSPIVTPQQTTTPPIKEVTVIHEREVIPEVRHVYIRRHRHPTHHARCWVQVTPNIQELKPCRD